MNYKTAPAEKSTVKVTISYSKEEWDDAINKAYARTKSKYSVPGFRKGKVPKPVLENFYGKGVFFDEAFNILFSDSYPSILEKEKANFTSVGDPSLSVDEISEEKGVTLTAVVPVKPDVEIGSYKGLKIKKYEYNVTDEDVDKEANKILLAKAETVDVTDRPCKSGDTVNIDFSGSVVYDSSGALWQASFTGYQHGTDIPVIHMAAAPGGLPPCCQTGDVPWNNQLGNTPIYSASQKDGEEETFSAQAVIGTGEDAVGVYLDIVSDGVFFDTVYAQSFLYDTMRNLVQDGVDISRLTYDTISPTLTFAENPGLELSTGWDVPEGSATREMTQAELDALWGQELRDLQEVPILTGQVATNGTGEVIRATVRGYASEEAQSQGLECFSVHLVPDGPAVSDALDRVSFLEEPNNQVQGVGVYAAALESTRGQELPVTWYSAAFLTAGEAPVGVAVSAAQGEWGCSTKYDAEDLVARAVGQYIQEGVSLDTLAAGDSGGLELSFTPRPATDNTFSNVWNTFTTLYLEPQNLEVHGAQPDYTLTEEELASLWEDAPPWESFLTENDTVEAYGYFSDTGQLIKIFIGGYRDSPEIPGTQAYQLFSVCLYNSSLSGAWGQDVEAVLALADTTFQGVDIATERTDSTETYEDGSTMDFTCYSAAFQPSGGPTLATVDGFYSPVALTHEEARDFVERATEEILTHGVDMSGITGSP